MQECLVIMKQQEIIHVSQIEAAANVLFNCNIRIAITSSINHTSCYLTQFVCQQGSGELKTVVSIQQ